MALNITQTLKEVEVNNGEIIILQGGSGKSLNILHSGTVEILYTDESVEGLPERKIIEKSRKIYTLSGESFFGEYSLIYNTHFSKSVRAVENVKVSVYPFSKPALLNLPQKNPQLSLFLLKSLQKKIKIAINKVNEINKNIKLTHTLKDNISLIIGDILVKNNINISSAVSRNLASLIEKNYKTFINNGGVIPQRESENFLILNNSQYLDKDYNEFITEVDTVIDKKLLNFLYTFLSIDDFTLKGHLKFHINLFQYPLETLSDILQQLIIVIYNSETVLLNNINTIIGKDNSLSRIILMTKQDILQNSIFSQGAFSTFFSKNIDNLKNIKESILPFSDIDSASEIKVYLERISQAGTQSRDSSGVTQYAINIEDRARLDELSNSVKKILSFSELDETFEKQILELLTKFKQLRDRLDTSTDARRIRRKLTTMYWQVYYRAFLKSLKTSDIPLPVQLMFRFGFFDETLLSEKNKLTLLTLRDDNYEGEYGIYTTYEWLKLIYEEKKIPSINELGLTYEKYLREEEKSKSRKEIEIIKSDPIKMKQHKVYYEITQMITTGSRVCSDSIATAFPILADDFITIELSKSFLYKQQIANIIDEVRNIDFSLFYRETVFRTKFRAELINEEVLPDIIILPIYGANIMMWQDLETVSKHSKGRFLSPSFFSGDLKKSWILALARFRWELCRSEKGPLWADPVEGGLTGLYFDYINFYKKNPNLSDEAKEKIEAHIRNYRSNRERFAHDYLTWILYESKGISKLNKVLREIFYRTIPFRREIREKLMKLPNYAELYNKYKNITNRKIRETAIKYRKYEKDEEGLPQKLKENLEFFKM